MNLTIRPRRLRTTPVLRKMVRETRIDASTLIYPMFVIEGTDIREEIPSLPGQYRVSLNHLAAELESVVKAGVSAVMFFGIPAHKDAVGSGAWDEHGIVQEAFRLARKEFPDLYLIGDVCMCEYTDHGHCGILNDHTVDNDKTLKSLAKIAVSQVEAGADMAPLSMRRAISRRRSCPTPSSTPPHSTARSARQPDPRRNSVTAAAIRWTSTTAARQGKRQSSIWPRAQTS